MANKQKLMHPSTIISAKHWLMIFESIGQCVWWRRWCMPTSKKSESTTMRATTIIVVTGFCPIQMGLPTPRNDSLSWHHSRHRGDTSVRSQSSVTSSSSERVKNGSCGHGS